MSNYNYNIAVRRAKTCIKYVHKEYRIAVNPVWSYYWAKQILKPRTLVPKLKVAKSKSTGNHISRQIYRKEYIDMAQRLVAYVEKNHKLPNHINITLGGKEYQIRRDDYVYMFARILNYQYENGRLPSYANVNSKAFIKPTETKNEVYNYFVKKTGLKPKLLDDVCDWVKNKVNYQFYFDDEKSNKQVIDSKSGNCTDLLQFLINMAEALGYDWKVIHTQCAQSRTGHVYGKFRKKGTSNWFIRDIACIANDSDYCVWCNVDTGAGYLLAENPSWFLENLHR